MRKKAFFRLLAETIKKRIVAAFVCPILMLVHIITTLQRSLRRLCFHRCLCVHGGVCFRGSASERGLHPGGSASRGVCIQGVCIQGRSASVGGGAFASRGSASGGVCIWGVCIQGHLGRLCPPLIGYNRIRSTSGRYASYWNAFLSYL